MKRSPCILVGLLIAVASFIPASIKPARARSAQYWTPIRTLPSDQNQPAHAPVAAFAPTFVMPSNANALPRSGPRALCRQPDVIRNIIKSISAVSTVKNAHESVYDFQNSETSSVDLQSKSFSCHGIARITNGQDLPGTFIVSKNSAGDSDWKWMNDDQSVSSPPPTDAPPYPAGWGHSGQKYPCPPAWQAANIDYCRTHPEGYGPTNGVSPATAQPPSPSGARTAQALPSPAPAPSFPGEEVSLLQIVDRYYTAYDVAANDMAKGALRPARATAICALLRSDGVQGWIGTVATLSATNDGKGVLAVRLPGRITLSTANNGLSESLNDLKTLIPVGSAVQTQAMALHIGQQVRFSGTFARSQDDCLEEASLTVNGAMTSPEFLFRFRDVRPAD